MEFENLEVEKSLEVEEIKPAKKPLIRLENLTKEYSGKLVLKGVDLTIYENEFVTLLGPSGCGKTTILRLIGGFAEPSQGSVFFKDKNMANIPSYQRPTNTVFQRYALFPHLNVYDNVAFGLKILYKKKSKINLRIDEIIYQLIVEDKLTNNEYNIKLKQELNEMDLKAIDSVQKMSFEAYLSDSIKKYLPYYDIEKGISTFSKYFSNKLIINNRRVIAKYIDIQVKKLLRLVNLEEFELRGINKLSGGQQQRVAIARALINEPQVLLLDEPLAALDLKLRQEMQYELKELQRRTGITFIFVTHDQEEALTMSDKVVVMNHGEIQQIGTPQDVYNEPINRFVAKFIGESNLIEGIYTEDNQVIFDDKKFKCIDEFEPNQKVDIVIRPEDIEIVYPSKGKFIGVVDSVVFKGVYYETNVLTDKREYTIQTTKYYPVGRQVGLNFTPEDLHLMEKI